MDNNIKKGSDGSCIISDEMSARIDKSKIGQGNRSALGQLVTADSKFAPDNAKDIEKELYKNAPIRTDEDMYLCDGAGQRKYFNHQVENGAGKLIDI